ncbi:MAG: dienelactone hydrolase family protein [Cyanobacteria bacterium Co-bin13]|nr:dienelactone hydrolase family protein [Cyanobacteria bacterium Co-bin13]
MEDFATFDFASEGFSPRRVYCKGTGPAIVILHELPGLIPECVDLARRIADAGFTVYLPLLFGEPNQPFSMLKMAGNMVELCISQEFYCFARYQSSPITDWLRALCRKAHADCKGRGVGVIGMCLTGGFVLSLMADPTVIAPVTSQPSLPFGFTADAKATLGVYSDELEKAQARAAQGVPLLALRYSEDALCPPQKFAALRQVFGDTPEVIEDSSELCWRRGKGLETLEINSGPGNPFEIPASSHAVLTLGYQEAGHPAYRVFQRVVAFLKEQHFQ